MASVQSAGSDGGALGDSAVKIVDKVIEIGIDGKGWFTSAAEVAESALAEHRGDPEQAISAIVRSHLARGAAEGFVTSLGGFITLPVALPANILAFYALAARMSAAIAHLRGHDLRAPQVRAAVMLSLAGADAEELIAKAGILAPSSRMTGIALNNLPEPAAMLVRKGVGFHIIASVGKNTLTRFGRAVPVIGGLVGGGIDVFMLRAVADAAQREFPRVGAPRAAVTDGS